MYSPGMVGFGHIRRNASIAQALRCSTLHPVVVMIAEAWQAGAIPMPPGVDCVTLPALRKNEDGACHPRFLDVPDEALLALRAKLICSTIEGFEPDVLIADHLPLGALRELSPMLERIRTRGTTRCVLGLRDVLQDPETVKRTWSDPAIKSALRDCYDAIWIYGDPSVYDAIREYGLADIVAAKARYVGYIDERPRLQFAARQAAAMLATIPRGRLVLCVVGGGQDGAQLAQAFVEAELPPDTSGVVLTGLFMPEKHRDRVRRIAEGRPGFQVLEFVSETAPLIQRVDRVISMGGYNTMCEVLSFEKHALVVPRVANAEQWIRAQRLQQLGLVDVLEPGRLSPEALTEWMARDLGPPPMARSRIDMGALERVPDLVAELLSSARPALASGAGGAS
jgi:predicted glycosyltransferase